MILNQKAIEILFNGLAENEPRLTIVQAQMGDTTDPDPDAETFLKLDGKRWGRDLELYASVINLIGPRGVAATLLEEIVMPLKEISPAAFAKGVDILREYDIGEDPETWRELLDSLDNIKFDDYYYPVDERRLAESDNKIKDPQ